MQLSNLTVCYEGIQRCYRNAVVNHIREKFQTAFGEVQAGKNLVEPFQKEWESIRSSALERRRTGELSSEILDEFDLLGVNHFFNLFDARFEVLASYSDGADLKQRQREKTALLQWLKAVKNLRDPLSHPSADDMSFEDAYVLLDCARRVLVKLNLQEEAQRIRELTEQLSGRSVSANPDAEPLEDRLPPSELIVTEFVGRKRELEALWEWFDDPVSRRWLLAGEGGKGKSALAYEFGRAVKMRAPRPFQIVLWLSAKRRRFQEGTVAAEHADFMNCDTATVCILRHYGWLREIDFELERRKNHVIELLNEFPALVIVDDIDSLEGEGEDAIEFFTLEVPRTKSKVLFTSRRVIFGLANVTTQVRGFSKDDAESFITSRFQTMGLDAKVFTKDVVSEIVHVTEGSPLYIGDLLRLTSVMPAREAIRVWKENGGDEARRYALGREFELLTVDAKHVLIAACVTPGPSSFPELEAITGFSDDRVRSALAELQRLFLVPKPRLIEGEERFETNINTRALIRSTMGSSDVYRRMEAAQRTIAGKLPRVGRGQVGAIIRQAMLHRGVHEFEKAESLLQEALRKFPDDRDLHGVLGVLYKSWIPRRITDARVHFRRAWQLKNADERTYLNWSRMEISEHEWGKAAEAAERGVQMITGSRMLFYLAGYARSRLGRELRERLHVDRALEELGKAQALLQRALNVQAAQETFERSLTSDIYRALVLNLEALGNVERLPDLFRRWVTECPEDPNAQSEWERISRKFNIEVTSPPVADASA